MVTSLPRKIVELGNRRFNEGDVWTALRRLRASHASLARTLWFAFIVFFAALFLLQIFPYMKTWDLDSISYYTAAHGLRQGVNIYDDIAFQKSSDALIGKANLSNPYIYPPLLAQILMPGTLMTPTRYFDIFFLLNVFATFFSLWLIAVIMSPGRSPSRPVVLFLMALLPFNQTLITTIDYGQVNTIVFMIMLLSLFFEKNEKPLWAGFFLALAVFIKIYPVFFVLPYLAFKRWKYLASFIANCAALLGISVLVSGFKPWADFLASTFSLFFQDPQSAFLRGFQSSYTNVSLKAFLLQALSSLHLDRSLYLPLFAAAAVLLLAVMFAALRRKAAPKDLRLGSSFLFLLTLILAPISWPHHFVIVLFPAAYLFSTLAREDRLLPFVFLAVFLAITFYENPWGAFPYNNLWLPAALGLFVMLFFSARPPAEKALANAA